MYLCCVGVAWNVTSGICGRPVLEGLRLDDGASDLEDEDAVARCLEGQRLLGLAVGHVVPEHLHVGRLAIQDPLLHVLAVRLGREEAIPEELDLLDLDLGQPPTLGGNPSHAGASASGRMTWSGW